MSLAHVDLTIVQENSATPKQELRVINKLVLNFCRELDCVSQVIRGFTDQRLE